MDCTQAVQAPIFEGGKSLSIAPSSVPPAMSIWNTLCDDAHEAHSLQSIHRVVIAIAVIFVSFGGYAISTRFGHTAPPTSVAYGSERPTADNVVIGD